MTSKFNVLLLLIFFLGLVFIISCNQEGRGFALPAGDITSGKATFIKLSCNECHSITGIDWKGNPENLNVPLGGKVTTLKSYGELVTSVINPSHKLARVYQQTVENENNSSKMNNYNEVMTVQELVDIITFLQSEYEIKPPPTYYPHR
ncbi:MAG: sulfur-oxidizing protein SoxX [Saprospiraceae bacterium]|jgi:sulfur-oxidizing protein SoxX